MLKRFILCFVFFKAAIGFAFETDFADSLFQIATVKKNKQTIEFMLANFYPVFVLNYDDGKKWMTTCLSYAHKSGDQELIGRSYLNLGMTDYMRGDYPQCLANYQQALNIFEETENKKYLGRTYNEFSVYWRKQKQFDKAISCLDKSYQLCKECADTGCIETSLNNRAVVYEMSGNYNAAIVYYKKAEEIALSSQNKTGLAYIYADCAECYRLNGNLDSSMIQINRSIALMHELNNMQGLGLNLINKAALQIQLENFNEGIQTYLACIELAQNLRYTDLLKNAHYQLGKAYAEVNDFENSFYHIERSHFLRDSLLNEDKMKSLSEMEVKYETEKIENNLLAEQQDHIETELTLANRTKWFGAIAGVLISLIFLGLFLYQRKLRLTQAEKDQAVIHEREKGLQAVIDATEDERKRIARELHDGIGQQMSGLKLAWQNLTNKAENLSAEEKMKLNELTKILDQTSAEVRIISHQMLPKVLESFGLIPALEGMLESALKYAHLKYTFEHHNFDQRLPEKTELVLFRVSQELVNNAIKHADADLLTIQLFKRAKQIILLVEDNGKGFSVVEKNEGHGLLNIKSRLNTVNGTVQFENGDPHGIIVTIRIPVS
ncbi:MAG: sensor histidine kinase [Crocinitomicaceae bacterium]|nr:sensor histidine kinase [Crocinitomicaceae bacterium]